MKTKNTFRSAASSYLQDKTSVPIALVAELFCEECLSSTALADENIRWLIANGQSSLDRYANTRSLRIDTILYNFFNMPDFKPILNKAEDISVAIKDLNSTYNRFPDGIFDKNKQDISLIVLNNHELIRHLISVRS